MIKRYKKILLVLLLASTFIVTIVLLTRKTQPVPVTPTVIPKIELPDLIKDTPKIETQIEEVTLNLPQTAALLGISTPPLITKDEAVKITSTFDLETNLLEVSDTRVGQTFFGSTEKHFLTIYAQENHIRYSLQSDVYRINKQLSNNALIETGKQFLLNHSLLDSGKIEFSSFVYWKKEDPQGEHMAQTEKAEAELIQVNYTYKIGGFDILTYNPLSSIVNVVILPDGEVFRVDIYRLGGTSKSDTRYKIKKYDEIISSLNEAKVVSIDNGNQGLVEIKLGDLKNVKISNVKLAYLIDNVKSKYLYPILLLNGEVSLYGKTTNISFYLPAISSQP